MTDIFDLVHDEEVTFDLEIMGKKDGELVPTGVVWNVRDIGNTESQRALKLERDRMIGKRARTKEALSDEDLGAMMGMAMSDPSDEMLAHCVTGWEWGDKTLGKYKLKYSQENVLAILKGEPWIRQQVLTKVIEISGFTTA